MEGGENQMKNKEIMIFTVAFFVLFMSLVPAMATQVTPSYRWSPARPEQVIEQFFAAQCDKDCCAIKDLMVKDCKDLTLPSGRHVSLVGWTGYTRSEFYMKSVKLLSIIKLDNFCDPDQRIECYEVVGDFDFDNWAPYKDGPRTFYIYLSRDEKDVWKLYAPESFEFGVNTYIHKEAPWQLWYD